MDPDANLTEQRAIVARMERTQDAQPDPPTDDEHLAAYLEDARRLAELVAALDTWITRGGAVPAAWWKGKGGTR